ncbi:MAG: homoserine dehydrogenase [candidate division Zixibacteria bacterium]|nr:homoserine dehydrogenase [candidate division Zixibacteria bacterium]
MPGREVKYNRPLRLGVFGFGTVGQGLYHLLREDDFRLAEIAGVCVKAKSKKRIISSDIFSYEPEALLNDSTLDVIVELIDDAQAAYDIVTSALKRGKPVISANKKLIAENFDELQRLADENNTTLLYEASTCGSIPIINTLENYYPSLPIDSISGVFNASSQFILSCMQEGKSSIDDALAEAQRLGFAESDPSLDIKGDDTRYKLSILAAHAFGVTVAPGDIPMFGIQNISCDDIVMASKNNCRIKLVGEGKVIDSHISNIVAPVFIPHDDILYSIEGAGNAVVVNSDSSFGHHLIFGKGAGSRPTASAVVSDINFLSEGGKYFRNKQISGTHFQTAEILKNVYIRGDSLDWLAESSAIENFRIRQSDSLTFATAWVNLSKLCKSLEFINSNSFLAILPEQLGDDWGNDA